MWPNLQKRSLIHASNFLTLRMYNLACVGPTALKFGSRTFYHCTNRTENLQPNSVLKYEVMPCPSWKIRCVYKTPFCKLSHIYS